MNANETVDTWLVAHPKFIYRKSSEVLNSSYMNYGIEKPIPMTGTRVYLDGLPDFTWMLIKKKGQQIKWTVVELSTCAALARGDTFKELQDNFVLALRAYLHGDETVPALVAELVDDERKRVAAERTRRERHNNSLGRTH